MILALDLRQSFFYFRVVPTHYCSFPLILLTKMTQQTKSMRLMFVCMGFVAILMLIVYSA